MGQSFTFCARDKANMNNGAQFQYPLWQSLSEQDTSKVLKRKFMNIIIYTLLQYIILFNSDTLGNIFKLIQNKTKHYIMISSSHVRD